MPRPIENPDWATDAVYTNPPQATDPNKLAPTAGQRAEGFRPTQKPPAQHHNHVLNAHGQYARHAGALDFNFNPINVVDFGVSTIDQGAFGALALKPDASLAAPAVDRFIMAHRTSSHIFRSPDAIGRWITNGAVDADLAGVDHPRALIYSQVAGLFILGGSAASANNDIYTSPAGAVWTARTDPTAVGSEHGGIAERTTGSAIIVLPTAEIVTSTDGIAWTERPIAGAPRSVIYSPDLDLFVAVGDGGSIDSSPDGIAWTDRSTGAADFKDVAWDSVNGFFVACGDAAAVWRSADGTTWVDVGLEVPLTGQDFTSIISDGGGTLYMVGDNFVLRSTDVGSNWEVIRVTSNLLAPFYVAHLDNRPYLFGTSAFGGTVPGMSVGMQVGPIATVQF